MGLGLGLGLWLGLVGGLGCVKVKIRVGFGLWECFGLEICGRVIVRGRVSL